MEEWKQNWIRSLWIKEKREREEEKTMKREKKMKCHKIFENKKG
jgi:hypothetical protein